MVGITGFGAYIPRLRLSRKAIAGAHAWLSPALMAKAKGERTLANWDEDAVTMAVEAARDVLGAGDGAAETLDALFLGSTTLPFADRLNASIVASALNCRKDVAAQDVTGVQRAGLSALQSALAMVKGGEAGTALVAAGESRMAKAASVQELDFGDGAAAVTVGTDNPVAEYLGGYSQTVDFVDHFRGAGETYDYYWEERWIRDEGYAKIIPAVIQGALEKAGLSGEQVDHVILPSPFPKVVPKLVGAAGIKAEAVRDSLALTVGDCGAAHGLLMLTHALEEAEPGQTILALQFGQGATALVFRTTDALKTKRPSRGVSGWLARRKEETNYMKLLVFKQMLDWEKGMRAEKDGKTALSVLHRKDDLITGFVGGRCTQCGTVQIPRSRICVNPNCRAVDTQEPYAFSGRKATILSWSADYLTYSMDPPQHYGMVTFEDGGRMLMDFTDVDPGTVDSGMEVGLAFRIKDFDQARGFRKYFWKALPLS